MVAHPVNYDDDVVVVDLLPGRGTVRWIASFGELLLKKAKKMSRDEFLAGK